MTKRADEPRKIIPINFALSQVEALRALAEADGIPLSTYIRLAALAAHPSTLKLMGRIGLPAGAKS